MKKKGEVFGAELSAALRRQVRFLQFLLVLAVLGCLLLGYFLMRAHFSIGDAPLPSPSYVQASAPNRKIVEKIIDPLRYSGFQDFIRPDVALDIDFGERSWALRNIHRYDSSGNVLLNENRYGVCEDLAAYTYQKMAPHFPADQYRVQFVEVVESSYFQEATESRHIVLRIADLAAGKVNNEYKKVYILDPALRRYGSPEYFDDYRIIGPAPILEFIKSREPDSFFRAGSGPPIVINRAAFVALFVEPEEGRFDPDNYRITLTATRRYQFARTTLFAIRKTGGKLTFEEKEYPIRKIMTSKRYKQLKEAVVRLHSDFESRLSRTPEPAAGTAP